MPEQHELRITAVITRGNGKSKLSISVSDKRLTDLQVAVLAYRYLENQLRGKLDDTEVPDMRAG